MFFTVVFKTISYFFHFDVIRKCRCNIYCHVALQLMLLCFSCEQVWVPVPGIKTNELIIHTKDTMHTCVTQFTCTKKKKKYIYIYIYIYIIPQKPINVHKLEYIFIKYISQMQNNSQIRVQNFECLKFTSLSWTVNVQIVFCGESPWICVCCISETFMAARFSNVGHSYSLANQMRAHHSTNV